MKKAFLLVALVAGLTVFAGSSTAKAGQPYFNPGYGHPGFGSYPVYPGYGSGWGSRCAPRPVYGYGYRNPGYLSGSRFGSPYRSGGVFIRTPNFAFGLRR